MHAVQLIMDAYTRLIELYYFLYDTGPVKDEVQLRRDIEIIDRHFFNQNIKHNI